MKLFLWSLLLFLACASFTPKSCSLTVQVYGFGDNTGKSFIGLYRTSDPWPEIKKQYIGKVVSITNKTATVSFDQLSAGTYAIAVFHDKNNNGILDKNLVGMPVERYGFSNNARVTFSAPSFNSAAVELNTDKAIGIYIK
jgi:uncharacterized protein (DUF2141 family)